VEEKLETINSNYEMKIANAKDSAATTILLSKAKPRPCRPDYRVFNFCATCNLKFTKEVLRCPDCKQKVRVKPWHRPKIIEYKRI
jgi:DNA-directed RNA polymerase subunit RPC12/RpoP